jgi:hypothetical protein
MTKTPCRILPLWGYVQLRFYLLFGDEHILSAPRSGAGGGGVGGRRGGTPPSQRFFLDLRPPSGSRASGPQNLLISMCLLVVG